MTYRLNGEVVTRDEFMADSVGITAGVPGMIQSFEPFKSPIDGSIISSKSQLRSHEKQHGVVQVGDAYEGIVKDKQAEAREKKHEKKIEERYEFKWT